MTFYLTPDQVTAIHDLQSAQPLRSQSALAGATTRPQSGWAGTPLYPTVLARAAVLLISLCQAQAFLDGNKRTAWVTCDVFLTLNSYRLAVIPDDDILSLMDGISRGTLDTEAVTTWLTERTTTATTP